MPDQDREPSNGPAGPTPPEGQAAPRRERPFWLSFALNLIVALVVISLVQAFVVKVFNVPSGSMEQTLNVGDRILVNRLAYTGSAPQTGDVVVFSAQGDWEPSREPSGGLRQAAEWFGDLTGIGPSSTHYLVKRVIGTPGDTVECCTAEGAVTVNGAPLDEPYVYNDYPFSPGVQDCTTPARSARCFGPVRVGEGQYVVLGDHRANSADSVISCRGRTKAETCARTVEEEAVVGRVVLTMWPLGREGLDENPAEGSG
ncbi:signal peptidase I [Zhihengliuella flava]|uniref:Signal peptidase I n=1 Tax=Zhihengliuella flava TaxID=1285193 RepID=A0A931GDZ7_9MICC|nr:signal peptidase I [Zhihengliuella flava]MBG6083943.1 signal peptidase I [Zhihengliuella flava]